VSHNVKAIYQRYWDGTTAIRPPVAAPAVEAATRYVDCLGGADAVVAKAREYIDAGDRRFAAELLNHAVFADERNTAARSLLADVYEFLGFGPRTAPGGTSTSRGV